MLDSGLILSGTAKEYAKLRRDRLRTLFAPCCVEIHELKYCRKTLDPRTEGLKELFRFLNFLVEIETRSAYLAMFKNRRVDILIRFFSDFAPGKDKAISLFRYSRAERNCEDGKNH